MTLLERIAGVWFSVLNQSAQSAADLTARLSTRRRVSAVEGAGSELLLYPEGELTGPTLGRIVLAEPGGPARLSRLLRGSHVTLELDPRHFLFRSIDLPGRATEFIEPIVRTQIDRLTPWRPEQVLFGWSRPLPTGLDGAVAVTVAATDRALVMPLVDRIQAMGTAAVVARVPVPAFLTDAVAGAEDRLVVVRTSAATLAAAFWRRIIGAATAAVVALVIGSSLLGQWASMRLTSEAEDLDREGAAKRALVAGALDRRDPGAGARRFVEQRKDSAPFATLVLDAVSRILPDNSYVTTFDITGTRLQLVGFTSDAPALIRLLEASPLFAGAAFFAPTTRLPEDPADRFSIEATIRPDAFPR